MPRKANPYSRVTEICGFIDSHWYQFWIKHVGVAEADRISKESADFGTGVHQLVEDYLKGVPTPPIYSDRQVTQAGLIINWCKQSNVKPVMIKDKPAIELALISEQYKLTGHPDLIATFGDDPTVFLLDWKTSKEARRTYILQLAAYSRMLQEQYSISCDNGAIIRVPSDPNVSPQFEAHTINNLQTKWWPIFNEALDIHNFLKGKEPYKGKLYV